MYGFDDIIGRDTIKDYIRNAMKADKLSHAYIFNGEKDSGKEFIADIFAAALQCEDSANAPCGKCHACIQSQNNNNPDIIKITKDKLTSISVDNIRENLNQDIDIKPYNGRYKIYIIIDAENMNTEAQNALLKTLEEPPEYGMIMLLTSGIEKLLPTIQSRCITLNLLPVSDEKVIKFLMDTVKVPDYVARVCAAFARGNLGRAKALASSEDFNRIRSDVVGILKYSDEMRVEELIGATKRLTEYKLSINDYLNLFMVWYRDVLLFKATNDLNGLIFKNEAGDIARCAKRRSYEDIELVLKALDNTVRRIEAHVNLELVLQLLFEKIKEFG
ncbi:MAG: DNA polymerase III subunit delta [Lachnospiraceae bacterium]|nr:DNA polymerase III subunit delta [Lachnospiraceae bacterium]